MRITTNGHQYNNELNNIKAMKIYIHIALLASIISLFSACGIDDSKKYVLTPEETLQAYLSKEDILSPEKLANILLCGKDTIYRFIDIRTPHEFAVKHLKGAINIPSKDILDEEHLEILNQDEKINIIFCKSNCQAINSYLTLKQLNFKNIKVALGGYDFIDKYVLASYGIKTGVYNDEKPRFDFLRLVAGKEQPVFDSIARPSNYEKNPNRVVVPFDENCPDLN
jgi:rhodanese-related sulfurtransferase